MAHGHDPSGGSFAGGMMGALMAVILVAIVAIVVVFLVFGGPWGAADENGDTPAPDVPDADGVPNGNGDANGNGNDDGLSSWFQQDPGYRLIG